MGISQFLLVALFMPSCDLIEYHPYDTNDKDLPSNLNQTNISLIEKLDDNSDTIRFVFMGDTQRFYDETTDFVADEIVANRAIADAKAFIFEVRAILASNN